jgi:hypothetical protein
MMRPMLVTAAAVAISAAIATFSPKAEAARIVVGVGLPAFAVVAPAPVIIAPAPFVYGPRFYAPYAAAPVFGWRARYWGGFGRPYVIRHGRR